MWKFLLADKDEQAVNVTDDHCLSVSDCGAPPFGKQKTIIFSSKFLTSAGSDDLGINGSVTPVEFCINADENKDIYITRISFILGYGTGSNLYEFADAGTPLTNGVKLSYFNSFGEEVTIMNPKANYSFQRASGQLVTNTNWETRGFAAAGDYGYFVNINLKDIMLPYGIKLDKGTNQKACITIRDDCRAADLFNCQAFGFERIE